MNGLLRNIEKILRNRRTRRKLQRTISMFAAIVVFFTTYALVLPAITMEKTAGCGIEEHQHDDSCYEDQLICGLEESEEHQHTADCYERVLVCGKEAHTHSAACYPAEVEAEVETGADGNTGNTVAVDETDNTDGTVTGDTAGNGADTFVETTEGGETEVPASDFSDTTVVIDPSDPSGQVTDGQVTEDPAALAADPAAAVAYPAVIFDDAINVHSTGLNTDTEIGTESGLQTLVDETSLFVHVEADEETFPEGTTMVLSEVTDDTIDTVATAVEGALSAQDAAANAQQAEDASKAQTRTRGFHALDISFYDLEGNKIEPLRPVRVSITSDAIRTAVQDETTVPVVVHVEDQTAQTAVSDNAGGAAAAAETAAAETAAAGPDTALNSTVVEAAETTEAAATGRQEAAADAGQTPDTLTFEAGAFSVYAIVYTVDFHYAVNGKMYEFSIPGGGFVSLEHLVELLGISNSTAYSENGSESAENGAESTIDNAGEVSDINTSAAYSAADLNELEISEETKKFVTDVESVEFSSPELAWVGKVNEATSVGELKEANGLEVEYSAELTEEQIAEINAQTVGAGDWALISMRAFDTEETLTVTMKDGEVFTVRVTDAQITTMFLSDSGEMYEVTVTYDEAANIPEGSTLRVTEFSEEDEEYEHARNSVLADKKARGEWVDLSNFNLAALDISILNPDGEEIEPEAPVQVDIRIKELPGVENLEEIADTLAIQHHVEVEDGVVVETVFDGNAEASFKLETNETVAEEGMAVDPDDVSEEDFADPETFASYSGEGADDEIDVSFQTPVFSTFTVTWGSAGRPSQSRVSGLSNGKYILYARDASNNNYYALVPGTELNSVQVTLNNNTVQYSGNENLYWDVEVSGNTYYFSFTENGTKYYLAAGTTGDHVSLGTSKTEYGNANTTSWGEWSNCIHSAQDTFLQSYNGTFKTWNVSGQNNWGNRSLIYFENDYSAPHTTIHYVDEYGNELPVSNGQPVNDVNGLYWNGWDYDTSTSSGLNYLIYDVDGYEYAYTYRNSDTNANRITPVLRLDSGRWYYTTSTNRDGIPNRDWEYLNNNDDIYVVYKSKAGVPTGGTPVPKITGEKPEVPTITKGSVVNGDGTNTLSLSVTGHTSIMEAEKLADVIVVFDVSGSMNYRMDSETTAAAGQRRMDYAQAATTALANSLLGKNTTEHPDLIRMSLISFSNTAQKAQDFTTSKTDFNRAVSELPSPEGGTNWEYALQLANEMAVESDRATFVIFVTDGNPTFRQTRGILNNSTTNNGLGVWKVSTELERDVGGYYNLYRVYGGGNNDNWGRNYAAALVQAQSIVSHNKNFYTIGISNDVTNLTNLTTQAGAGADHSKTATSNEELVAAFDDIAASIIAHLGHSDVQITDGITALTQTVQKSDLVSFAEDDFTYYKGHAATAEDVTSGLAAAVGDMVWESWTPSSEGCAEAVYNTATGAVEWNMGETFMLEDGYTYQVRFKVWPSQEAYDLLADLNNSSNPAEAYAALDENIRKQISEPAAPGGMYTLKTNSETSYTYREATKSGETVTPVGNPSEPGSFPDVDPLELTTKPLKVKKLWHNNYVDSRTLTDHITMELYGVDSDGTTSHDFKTIILSKYKLVDGHYVDSNGAALYYNHDANSYEYEDGTEGTPIASDNPWYAENNYISYGLVTYNTATNAGAKVYETGHDFTLRETDDEAHYYELTAGIYRPMFINGTPTILEKVDAAPDGMSDEVFHYSDGAHHYYRLDGKIYRDTHSDTLMIATNTHRSYMDLNKVVVDESGAAVVDDTEFEYKITFTVPDNILNYDSVEKYIWFSVYDSVARRTLAPSEYTYDGNVITPAQENHIYSGPEYANYLVATSGQQMTLKIKQGWNVRFLNLPIGTTYSFEEINIPEEYNFVKAEVSGTRWIANMVDGTDQGSAQAMSSLPANTSGVNSNTGISGKIEFANARYSTTYTNRTLTQKVNILKTSQDGTTPLPGAVFSLYTKSGYEADPKQASRTNLTSDEDGKIELGALACGPYYLEETSAPAGYILLPEPVTITVSSTGVTYMQSDNSMSQSGNGISHEAATDPYTLTVTNNAGYELPSTGGPGTRLFTILGTALIAGAGLLLWMTRKSSLG